VFTIASLSQATAFFKLATEVGVLKTILLGIVLLSIWFGFRFIAQYKFTKSAEKTGIKISDESDLRNNTLFTKGSYFLNYEVPNIVVFMTLTAALNSKLIGTIRRKSSRAIRMQGVV
jgi:hypothetical protein